MERGHIFHDPADPCGKSADRRKIQQKLRGTYLTAQHHVKQIKICDAIAQNPQYEIRQICRKIPPFPPPAEVQIQPHVFFMQPAKPLPHPKDADIFRQITVLRLILNVHDTLADLLLFLPVAIIPLVRAIIDQIPQDCSCHCHKDHNRIHTLEQVQIDRKPQYVLHKPCESRPDRLRCLIVIIECVVRLGKQIDKLLPLPQRVGACAHLVPDLGHDMIPQFDPPKSHILPYIRLHCAGCRDTHRKKQDRVQQPGQRAVRLKFF